jgi:hypothetical protein
MLYSSIVYKMIGDKQYHLNAIKYFESIIITGSCSKILLNFKIACVAIDLSVCPSFIASTSTTYTHAAYLIRPCRITHAIPTQCLYHKVGGTLFG